MEVVDAATSSTFQACKEGVGMSQGERGEESGASVHEGNLGDGPCLVTVGVLGSTPDEALASVADIAAAMNVCVTTIRRMIARGELPPPVSLGKDDVWTVGWIRRWIEERLAAAARESKIVARHSA